MVTAQMQTEQSGNAEVPTRLPLRVMDLFAGAGGLSLGFSRFQTTSNRSVFHLAGAVEMNHDACETLRANHVGYSDDGSTEPVIIEGDITDSKIHDTIYSLFAEGSVDIVVGGPPCQSFSMLGTRSGKWVVDGQCPEDDRDFLFQEYIRIVDHIKPKFVVLENVDGIRSKRDADGVPYLTHIVEGLEKVGYSFKHTASKEHYLLLNAADYGVPQLRKRIFLVGNRMGLTLQAPAQTHMNYEEEQVELDLGGMLRWVTLRDAIGDLPRVYAHYTRTDLSDRQWKRRQRENLTRYNGEENIPFDNEAYLAHYTTRGDAGKAFLDFVHDAECALLRYHRARDQQLSDIKLFAGMPEGFTSKQLLYSKEKAHRKLGRLIKYDMESFLDKYRKQAWESPGTTIFAHMERDGNRFIHPDGEQARTFTVREAARIQSFPDNYVFAGAMKSRYRQIGNAVPPLLARAIAAAIYDTLIGAGLLTD